MKKLIGLFLLLTLVREAKSQDFIKPMNECEFFDFLEATQNSNRTYYLYQSVLNNNEIRTSLIKRLEEYTLVFGDFWIAPMYLEDAKGEDKECAAFIQKYKELEALTDAGTARANFQKCKMVCIREILIELCDLNNKSNNNVEMFISEFKNPLSIEMLYYYLNDIYFHERDVEYAHLPRLVKEQNLEVMKKRMDVLDRRTYVHYENYNSTAELIKGFEMYHENDVLLCIKNINQDRELTGGFKFTIITDYLKWRWLRIGNKKEDNILTYQTLSLVGAGYTPYIRYRNNTKLADTMHKLDRPFASYFCIERAKHRTWRGGLVRHRGEFQVGSMGISQGRKIQAKLHEDVITSSQYVYGWDNQIANGGRLIFQANHKLDLLLASTTNRYPTIFRPFNYKVHEPKRYGGLNLVAEFEGKIGTIMTTIGGGLRFSTLDFLKQSGNNMLQSKKCVKDDFGWKFDCGINYRYVVHNSLLEGMGVFEPFDEDPYDKVSADKFVLKKDEIARNLFILDYGISLKWRKTTLFFRQFIHNLEYRSRLNNTNLNNPTFVGLLDKNDIEYYKVTARHEQNVFLNNKLFGTQIYGYGTLGLSWFID